jgi:hypothetical protein
MTLIFINQFQIPACKYICERIHTYISTSSISGGNDDTSFSSKSSSPSLLSIGSSTSQDSYMNIHTYVNKLISEYIQMKIHTFIYTSTFSSLIATAKLSVSADTIKGAGGLLMLSTTSMGASDTGILPAKKSQGG